MSDQDQLVRAVRKGVGLFALSSRGVIEVGGGDRARWLNGMVTNDIEGLDAGGAHSGCYALLLTREGRVISDLHVIALPEALLLELDRDAVDKSLSHLSKYIIADDVVLTDRSESIRRVALEGPRSADVLAVATRSRVAPEANCWREIALAGTALWVATWSSSGESAFQLFTPAQATQAVCSALREAGRDLGLVEADEAIWEILRVEAGTPRYARELDESVLPGEARLEHAISTRKGCFLGQEVITRLRSRGRINHLLVGLRFARGSLPAEGSALSADSRQVGQVTSTARSPDHGAIGLGFVQRSHSDPGTELSADGVATRVVSLPFHIGFPADGST